MKVRLAFGLLMMYAAIRMIASAVRALWYP